MLLTVTAKGGASANNTYSSEETQPQPCPGEPSGEAVMGRGVPPFSPGPAPRASPVVMLKVLL